MPIDTNIVIAEMHDGISSSAAMIALAKEGVKCFTFGQDKIRLVTHLDFDDLQLQHLVALLPGVTREKLHAAAAERLPGMY
jgi:threonine aldolase